MPAASLSLAPSVSVSQQPPPSSTVHADASASPTPAATIAAKTAITPAPNASTTPIITQATHSTLAPQASDWTLRASDGSVRNALSRWAKEAGWQFVWDVPTDFGIDATATIHGTLEEALHQVVDALSNAQVPIRVVMYRSNRVLRIIPKGVS
nr:toxin co-regulated pilus biosynthesis Q family protein [Paraburkholderia sp. NMBU_R16]